MKRCLAWMLLICLCFSLPGCALAQVHLNELPPEGFGQDCPGGPMQLTAMWLGVCDGFLLEHGEEKLLIDGGIRGQAKYIDHVLQKWGIDEIGHYFNSHPHDDHLGAVTSLVYNEQVRLGEIMSAFPAELGEESWQKSLDIMRRRNVPLRTLSHGEEMMLGGCKLTFLQNPDAFTFNDLSMMTRVDFGSCSMLLTADITYLSQRYFADTLPPELLKADILKLPHHGYTGTEQFFLEAVDPVMTFVSNDPAESLGVVRHMEQIGMPLLHSFFGTIVFVTDGQDWYVNQYANVPEREGIGRIIGQPVIR